MTIETGDNNIAELLGRVSRTSIQSSAGIIIDRQRVDELTKQLIKSQTKAKEDYSPEGKSISKMTTTKSGIAIPSENNSTVEPEITGSKIGSGQSAEFTSLEEHQGAICECQKCPLGATRTNFVYGVGNPNADLMFVGEAPGKNEDLQGEPFVGRGGKLLDKIIEAINLTRADIYIANILKCRPPANRDPLPDEMEHCFPYLKEQIALVKPKIICSLGRISAQSLLKSKLPLGKMRGEWHSYQGIPLRVTYHPAALLRNPNFKRGCWEDMQIVEAEYKRLTA